ncbi:sulfurtransferase [Nocardioides sp.]|uniref:sulfurtransferase n=1 Tax=Nocardioides sp. TaxID=35761 RepID=UPI003562F4E1
MTTHPLIDVPGLNRLLGSVSVLDVRYRMGGPPGPAAFAAGHVPGAVYVDLETDLSAPPGPGGRHPLPTPADFEAAARRLGVRSERPVVVYDDWAGHAAGRAWWLLRYHGHRDVRILDGGWAAWRAEHGPVETGPGTVPGAGDFTARPGHLPVVDAENVLDVPVLVDARAAERYRGEVEPIDPVAGHIPGAVNVPTAKNLTAEGRFRPAAELRELYAAVGATPSEADEVRVAAYCGSGVTAVHDIVAMEIAGITAALYPGSWSGWIADPSRPVTSECP